MNRTMMLGVGVALTAMVGLGAATRAEEATAAAHDLMPVTVIGSKDQVARLPGSGEFLDVGDIRSYVASRHPAGARPGKPQTALAGLELIF